jgi:wyosine [tRNA(Phe)-imidazoG37] synthetase (radical SAM superfamily)
MKVCTFNCLYCHYGWTKVCPRRIREKGIWPAVADILGEVESALATVRPEPAYITFSGNGEPTLHPRFSELVEGVRELRDRYAPDAKTAVLSNSTTISAPATGGYREREGKMKLPACALEIDRASLRAALDRLDVRIMKLDCASDSGLVRYNRPCGEILLENIAVGLMELDAICIQSLFAGGDMGNAGDRDVAAWIDIVTTIRPFHVQLYTLDRECASTRIEPLPLERLYEIGGQLRARGINAEVYSAVTSVAGVLS